MPNIFYEISILFGMIAFVLFGILFFGCVLSKIPTFKFNFLRGFESLSVFNVKHYKDTSKEESKDWDSAATPVRQSKQ